MSTETPTLDSTDTTGVYAGIADCHGIESFYSLDQVTDHQATCWKLRAMSNPQRHALVYNVRLVEGDLKEIHE